MLTVPTPADVYLHVGLPKTGTSYLQSMLWSSRQTLADHGVLVPGDRRGSQNQAVWDLMGRRTRGVDQPHVAGSWDVLVSAVRDWSGSHAVLSEEFLSLARPRQARRAVDAFAPARVHLVVTVRDLARVLVGSWQQQLAKGHTWTWEEYSAAVRDPQRGPAAAGLAFWLRQDVGRVIDNWESAIPRERIHVVTVPPSGSARELLAERFATATRIDPAWLQAGDDRGNVSVGVTEAEVLRRLNVALGDRLNDSQYTRVVAHGLRPVLQDRPNPTRMALPEEHRAWVTRRASSMIEELRRRDYDVVGDLEDLLPLADSGGSRPDDVQPEPLADAAVEALAAAVEQYARLWWRVRARKDPVSSAQGPRLASSLRAVAGRARMSAFDMTDRSPLARRIAVKYLSR